jgi:lipopolysaccharide export system protein LptA
VEADKASINKKAGSSSYTGNVIVQQGSMRIAADSLIVNTHDGKLKTMVAKGQPVNFQQQSEKGNRNISAVAGKMTFHADSNVVVFEQDAALSQGANKFSSNRITYNIGKDIVDAGKKSGGDRVTITIQPSTENSTPDKHSPQ